MAEIFKDSGAIIFIVTVASTAIGFYFGTRVRLTALETKMTKFENTIESLQKESIKNSATLEIILKNVK